MTHIILRIRTLIRIAALCLALAISQGCTESDPVVSTGLDSTYTIARMQLLRLSTPYSSGTIRWTATSPDGKQKLISTSGDCLFVAADEGVWQLTLRITDGDETIQETSTINVVHEVVEYSPYLTEVYEYHPAPGQFVNKMPRWRSGDTAADMARKVADAICGQTEELISTPTATASPTTHGMNLPEANTHRQPPFIIMPLPIPDPTKERLQCPTASISPTADTSAGLIRKAAPDM